MTDLTGVAPSRVIQSGTFLDSNKPALISVRAQNLTIVTLSIA